MDWITEPVYSFQVEKKEGPRSGGERIWVSTDSKPKFHRCEKPTALGLLGLLGVHHLELS